MATPVGHYLLGLSVTQLLARNSDERRQGLWLATIACVPDLDVIPGLLVGKLNQFHHGASHSFFAAALFSLVGVWVFRWWGWKFSGRLLLLLFLLYASHNVLDTLCIDTGPPFGVPLLWPWSQETYQSPWLLLPDVHHTIAPLLSTHNVLLAIQETLIFLPLAGFIHTLKVARQPWSQRGAWFYGSWFLSVLSASVFYLHGY
jgi:inner membrane protein